MARPVFHLSLREKGESGVSQSVQGAPRKPARRGVIHKAVANVQQTAKGHWRLDGIVANWGKQPSQEVPAPGGPFQEHEIPQGSWECRLTLDGGCIAFSVREALWGKGGGGGARFLLANRQVAGFLRYVPET